MPPLRAVIADDHPLFRQGLARLLRGFGIDVVGEASNGLEAIEAAARAAPDVVVLDLNMPGPSGVEVIRRLVAGPSPKRVLVLSVSVEEADVTGAILAGAGGYVMKDRPVEELVAGVRAVATGESLVSPPIAPMLMRRVRERRLRERAPANPGLDPVALTAREREVLALVVDGRTNDEIGDGLRIGAGTARNYVSSLLMKLGAENRVQAAVRAVREGIV